MVELSFVTNHTTQEKNPSTIYIDGIVAVHPARLIMWLLLPSLPIAINNGIATIKLAEVLLLQTSPEGRGANQTPHHDTTIK